MVNKSAKISKQELERFIPFRRADIIKMCADDAGISASQQELFQSFCKILCATFHHEMHQSLETLKDCYAPFNPDNDTRRLSPQTQATADANQRRLEQELTKSLNRANYEKVTEEEVNQALHEESIFKVKLFVDFNDFEEVLFFRRGVSQRQETIRIWFGLKKQAIDVCVYERVVIYVRFKNADYFQQQGRQNLLFEPGTSLIKLFRNVPKNDLEMLFPNTEIRMKPIDKLIIGVPTAVGGLFMVITKLGSTLLLVLAVIAFWLGLRTEPVEINQTALIALSVGLGGFASFLWRQFNQYKNRKIQFMKQLSENLYHKNLDNNAGVFFNIIDAAEEEECKETILAYYHLIKSGKALSIEELDATIEQWFNDHFDCQLDFEMEDALAKLLRLQLIEVDNNAYKAVDLDVAMQRLDQSWDNIYTFNQG